MWCGSMENGVALVGLLVNPKTQRIWFLQITWLNAQTNLIVHAKFTTSMCSNEVEEPGGVILAYQMWPFEWLMI